MIAGKGDHDMGDSISWRTCRPPHWLGLVGVICLFIPGAATEPSMFHRMFFSVLRVSFPRHPSPTHTALLDHSTKSVRALGRAGGAASRQLLLPITSTCTRCGVLFAWDGLR